MRFFWDFVVILSVVVWVIVLVAQGYISTSIAVLVFLLTPIILALGRGLGGNVGRMVRFLFRIGIPLASLATLLVIFSGGSFREIMAMLSSILTLCLVLMGLYVIFFGLFSSKKHN